MFLQFLSPKGNPVYVRPDRVVALGGYHTTHDRRPALATHITLEGGGKAFVLGDVDVVKDALEAWHVENAPKMVVGELASFEADAHALRLPDDWEDRVADQPVGLTDQLYGAGDNTTGLVRDPNSASGFRVA